MTSATKTCSFCSEKIPSTARVCSKCGNFQKWPAFISLNQPGLALLIALIAVISAALMALPIALKAMRPDNSEISLVHIDRTDLTVPIIASNKGTRPGIMLPVAMFTVFIKNSSKDNMKKFHLIARMADNSRKNSLILENTSRQFLYVIQKNQPNSNIFKELLGGMKNMASVWKCNLSVQYLEFSGERRVEELTVFDSSVTKAAANRKSKRGVNLEHWIGAHGCFLKLPPSVQAAYRPQKK